MIMKARQEVKTREINEKFEKRLECKKFHLAQKFLPRARNNAFLPTHKTLFSRREVWQED